MGDTISAPERKDIIFTMSNFLRSKNILKAPAIALVGAAALSGCANAEQNKQDTITCADQAMVNVKPGDTLTKIIREKSSDGSLSSAQIHNIVTHVAEEWEESGRSGDLPDMMEIDPSDLPAHNTSNLPELQAEEIIVVPMHCSARVQD